MKDFMVPLQAAFAEFVDIVVWDRWLGDDLEGREEQEAGHHHHHRRRKGLRRSLVAFDDTLQRRLTLTLRPLSTKIYKLVPSDCPNIIRWKDHDDSTTCLTVMASYELFLDEADYDRRKEVYHKAMYETATAVDAGVLEECLERVLGKAATPPKFFVEGPSPLVDEYFEPFPDDP